MGGGDCARVTAQTERHLALGYPVFWPKYQHVQADSCSEDYRPFERLEIEFIWRTVVLARAGLYALVLMNCCIWSSVVRQADPGSA